MLDFIKKLVKKINKLDDFINLYKENAGEVSMPSYAYMNWGIKLLDSGDEKKALELLEKTNSIRILDINKFEFIKAPSIENLHGDSGFELFYDEFKRVIGFKNYIKTAEIDTLENLLN